MTSNPFTELSTTAKRERFAFGIGQGHDQLSVSYMGETRRVNGPHGPHMEASEADLIANWMRDLRASLETASAVALGWPRSSSEDTAKPSIKPHFVEPRVTKAEGFEDGASSHDTVEALNADDSVDLAFSVADAQHVSGTGVAIELLFKGDEQFLVVGERRYAVDELRIHSFLPVNDLASICFLMKAAAVIAANWNRPPAVVWRFARAFDSRA